MNHPEELLAGFVDGTLVAEDRAFVRSHLTSCDRCRREVDLARAGREALSEIAEITPSADVASRALAEASSGSETGSRAPAPNRRFRVAAFAAVAAVLALLAVSLPHLGGVPGGVTSANESAAAGGTARGPFVSGRLSLENSPVDYDPELLPSLATSSAESQSKTTGATSFKPVLSSPAASSDSSAAAALACLDEAFPGFGGTPIRLIRAKFDGTPAYLGVYLEGPGVGLRADAISVRVATVQGCTILSSHQAKL